MWSKWILPALVCTVLPVMIPLMLLAVLTLSVSAAMHTTPREEFGGEV